MVVKAKAIKTVISEDTLCKFSPSTSKRTRNPITNTQSFTLGGFPH